jgi:ribonuclease D
VRIYLNDLPADIVSNKSTIKGDIAVDTEAMGLKIGRDRLCLLQIADENQNVFVVQFDGSTYNAPNLKALLEDKSRCKIMHFARFDMRIITQHLGVEFQNVFCTHIGSRVARTYTDSHSLKDLCRDLLGVQLQKQATCSDWGSLDLTKEQKDYAAKDVTYLHRLRDKLVSMLTRENRIDIVKKSFEYLNVRIQLDIMGWENIDIFSHHKDK